MSYDLVSRAKALAYRAHAGQVDKSGRPYIEHVSRVAAAVSDDPVAEAVAWLHDVAEDCPKFRGDLSEFPHVVKMAVIRLTNWPGRVADKYYRFIKSDELALRVKLADISDNSSEERLALLDEKTSARLRKKYAKAIEALTGGIE